MRKIEIGMKIYDNDWFLKYDLSYKEAARCLRDWGVTFVLAQSRFLPMPDSAVKSEVPPELADLYATYDDRKFRDALAKEGIEYWAAVCMFFDPKALDADPSLRPVGSDGRPMGKIDWYVGISPSMEGFVSNKTAAIERAVRELEPDGVFLSFTRWPGFWELWMPHHTRQDFPEYSYDLHTMDRFVRETGVNVPTRDPADAASWIEAHAREAWTSWKCQVVVNVIRQAKDTCRKTKSDIQIMLNTLPFRARDFDGAQEKVFGQRIEVLADVVDAFEVMTYHQILKRPTSWLPKIGEEVKNRSGRRTVCTLQARPLYLNGIYARDNRSPTLSVEEFAEAVSAAEQSSVDGIVVFVWSDLLEEVLKQNDTRRVDAIRAVAERRRAQPI
ncbi:MAG TPA: hypothetical protein DCP08_09560 [Chloroflexi bacterium]|nr:hypothetical protein [Chloroflexota bacterium]